MIISSLLFAKEKHEGQTRIGGKPYISHPIEVASILEKKGFLDTKHIITALFHDLLEDTEASEQEIFFYGGKDVLTAVKILTKSKGYKMEVYIQDIRNNPIAKMVKLADRLHNLLSALVANEKFRKRYVKETEEFYLDLAKGTPFEEDILKALSALKDTFQY
ncbi:HD domain-containing protein [Lysinibacillus sp. CNPSo 3705]|uniref:HD domain-containing protein n=1 Tax=Lysinibacillus sp. CNPSo 3705 TaxID=3028148 RepID=UPI0023635E2D|nr:HD domain-containing protein [Lysinibacillus sp. CNPSo 3705]MDD1504269.1 HD domain-containing protein [Lysinibacillus sp. CNPSo 3705]